MMFGNRTAAAAFALSVVAFCTLAGTARADLLYQFSLNASDGIEAASFSFTVPTFVTAGESPAFTPFTLTDGTHTWTFVDDLAGSFGGGGCFNFGTGGTAALFSCGGSVAVFSTDAAFRLITSSGLPTAPGVYSFAGVGIFEFPGGDLDPSLTGTLDVTGTAVPVPAPGPGLPAILAGGGILFGSTKLLEMLKHCRLRRDPRTSRR